MIIHSLPFWPNALHQRFSPTGQAQEDASPVLWVRLLLDKPGLFQAPRLERYERGTYVQTPGNIAHIDSASVLVVGYDHGDVVLRRRNAQLRSQIRPRHFQ